VKVGIVSDLHCNHEGLLRALEIIGDADELFCLGDSICDFRFSNEVVATLRGRDAQVILGNHEEGFLGPHGARARAATWIDRSLLGWLARRPQSIALEVGGKKLLAGAFDAVGAARRLRLSAQRAIGAVGRGGLGLPALRSHPPTAGPPPRTGAGDQPRLGRRGARPRQRRL
jgi:hypothetical protein